VWRMLCFCRSALCLYLHHVHRIVCLGGDLVFMKGRHPFRLQSVVALGANLGSRDGGVVVNVLSGDPTFLLLISTRHQRSRYYLRSPVHKFLWRREHVDSIATRNRGHVAKSCVCFCINPLHASVQMDVHTCFSRWP
jgi:hypothetical protein